MKQTDARSFDGARGRTLSRRTLLVGAVAALPVLSLPGCSPWRVIRQAPHRPLAGNRDFALEQIDFGSSTIDVSERETASMVAAIRARMEAGGRWYESRPEFDVFPVDEAPPSAFGLRMGITILGLHRGTAEASVRLTVVEPDDGSADAEVATVDQIDFETHVSRSPTIVGLITGSTTRLMRNLGYALANISLRYLRERTSESRYAGRRT